MATSERRGFPRVPQPFEARFRLTGEMGASWHTMTLVNLSAGGIRFRSSELLDQGVLVEVQVQLPGLREPLLAAGRVAWSSMRASGVAEIGVELLNASEELRMQIDSVVRFLRSTAAPANPPAS